MFNSWPYYADDEVEAAIQCLRTGKVNYWTGEQGKLFEKEFAEACMTKYAVAVANGTLALELALHSLNIKHGDEVIVTPRSFIASASCIVLNGATPVFTEVDPISQNITASSIKNALTQRTRAIILVHHAGWPCDMDSILKVAKENDLYIIEDCAQAMGAEYKGKPVGSFGHMSAFSFCQDKIISTGGEGGMLVTNDEQLYEKSWSYKDHGKCLAKTKTVSHNAGFRWLHDNFGTNWRMTEMQAAIGRLQLRKLHNWKNQRNRNAAILNDRFKHLPALRLTIPTADITHAYYKYYAFVRPNAIDSRWTREKIVNEINNQGVPCYTGTCPGIYYENAFDKYFGAKAKPNFPVARLLGETSLMFPVHPTLNEHDMETFADHVQDLFNQISIDEALELEEA